MPLLMQDMQREILRQILEDTDAFNTMEVSSLSLVCKDWHKFISYHEIWFKTLEILIIDGSSSKKVMDKELEIFYRTQKDLYSSKITFYLLNNRLHQSYLGEEPRPIPIKVIADPKIYQNKSHLWAPRLNQKWLKTP
jgi:hypothetical protein